MKLLCCKVHWFRSAPKKGFFFRYACSIVRAADVDVTKSVPRIAFWWSKRNVVKYLGKERVWEFRPRQRRRKSGNKPVGAKETFPVAGGLTVGLAWAKEDSFGVLLEAL